MTHDRLQRVESIFREVRRRPEADRAAVLDEACGSDVALRAEVEAFLDVYDANGTEFDEPALGASFALTVDQADSVPARIGRYRIERRLGAGATGIAYAGVQDGTGATVAIKLLRSGLREPALLRRFEREARTLGKLHHPGIAKVYEVGVHADAATGDQVPFITMEYVDGPTLDQYVETHAPEPRERLSLLAEICDAVEHAHAKGIVHRDLKPGNILVDLSGNAPQPKVLDFGIARAIEPEGATATLRTRSGQLLGTIQYMSPEQAAGAVGRVDARSDVYALGVILYEMISDRLPYELAGLSIARAARVIEHDEPRPLGATSGRYTHDVNTIVMKALEKDPARRYASAAALADDLRRHLADEPIEAHPASMWYQTRKFARRNRAAVAIMGILCAAVVISSALALRANLAGRNFQAQLQRSLVREADALLAARGTDWYDEAMSRLEQAAGLPMSGDDAFALRNLIARCRSVREPGFVFDDVWSAVAGVPVALEADASGARVLALTDEGALWSRDRVSGEVLWQQSVAGSALTFAPDGAVVVGASDGRLTVCDPMTGETRFVVEGDGAVNALSFHPTGMLAVGRATGAIDLYLPARRGMEGLTYAGSLDGHRGGTHCLEFDPESARLASGGEDRTLRIWDLRTRTLERIGESADPVRVVRWSPRGRLVAYASRESLAFRLFNTSSGRMTRVRRTLHEDGVVRLLFASDDRIISASLDGTFKYWTPTLDHVATGRATLGPIVAAAGDSGRGFVAAHRDGTLSTWRLERAEGSHYFKTPHTAVFIPGTSRLVTPSHVLDLEASSPPVATPLDTPRIDRLAVHEASGRLCAAAGDAGLIVVDADGRVERHDVPEGRLMSLAVMDDGAVIAGSGAGLLLGEPGRLGVIAAGLGAVHDVAATSAGPVALTLRGIVLVDREGLRVMLDNESRGGGRLAAAGHGLAFTRADGDVEIRVVPFVERGQVLSSVGGAAERLAVSANGSRLATVDSELELALHDLGVDPIEVLWSRKLGWCDGLAFDPSGRFIFVAGRESFVLDAASGRTIARLRHGGATSLVVDARADVVHLGYEHGAVRSWRVGRLRAEGARADSAAPSVMSEDFTTLSGGHGQTAWGVAADPTGRWLATSDHYGMVKLWNAETRQLARDLHEGGGIAWTVAFSSGGRAVAAGVGADILVWEPPDTGEPRVLSGHTELVRAIAWHPVASTIVSAADDATVRLWSATGNTSLGALDTGGRNVRALAFRPDGSALAAAADDGSVLVWEDVIAGAAPDVVLDGHEAPVWAVAFDDSGRYLASGCQDGLVLVRDGVTLEPIVALRGEIRLVRSLSFGAGGRYLAAGCYTVDSIVWNLETLREALAPLSLEW